MDCYNQNKIVPNDYLKDKFYSNLNPIKKKKPFLHAETISLIRDSITGIYSPEDSFFLLNEMSSENEQIVPSNNQMIPNQREDSHMFKSTRQNETKINTDNDCGKAHTLCNFIEPNQLNSTFVSHELLTSDEKFLGNH